MNYKKHIALIYLGNFFFDARLINMTLSLLQENYRVSIIHTHLSDWNLYNKIFRDVEFHDIHLINTGWKKYLEFHKKSKKILQKEQYDVILSGDLYSLATVTACKHLAKKIYHNIGFSKSFSKTIIKKIFQIMIINLKKDEIIKISNFGNFKVKMKNERIGRNPKTKQTAKISARKVVTFKASKILKSRINK